MTARFFTRQASRFDPAGVIVPAASSATIIPRKTSSPARTSAIRRHELRTAASVAELLADDNGVG